MAAFAGEYIVNNGGTVEAKSALAVFTQADSRLIWVVKAVHGAVCFLFSDLTGKYYFVPGIAQNVVTELWLQKVELTMTIFPSDVKATLWA